MKKPIRILCVFFLFSCGSLQAESICEGGLFASVGQEDVGVAKTVLHFYPEASFPLYLTAGWGVNLAGVYSVSGGVGVSMRYWLLEGTTSYYLVSQSSPTSQTGGEPYYSWVGNLKTGLSIPLTGDDGSGERDVGFIQFKVGYSKNISQLFGLIGRPYYQGSLLSNCTFEVGAVVVLGTLFGGS
jgi:hypothetical protein